MHGSCGESRGIAAIGQTMTESERIRERVVVGVIGRHLGSPAQHIAMSLDVHDRFASLFDLAPQDIHQIRAP